MTKEKGGKKCVDCRFYRAYYIKGYQKFDRLKKGVCVRDSLDDTVTENREACENYLKKIPKEFIHKTMAMMRLDKIAEDMQAIRQIIEEGEK